MDANENQYCAKKTRLLQDYNRSVTDCAKAVRTTQQLSWQ
jgi:hypothetical protein